MYRYELLNCLEGVVRSLSNASPDYVNKRTHLGVALTVDGEPVNDFQEINYMINAFENDQNAAIIIHVYPSPQAKRIERDGYLKQRGLNKFGDDNAQ